MFRVSFSLKQSTVYSKFCCLKIVSGQCYKRNPEKTEGRRREIEERGRRTNQKRRRSYKISRREGTENMFCPADTD